MREIPTFITAKKAYKTWRLNLMLMSHAMVLRSFMKSYTSTMCVDKQLDTVKSILFRTKKIHCLHLQLDQRLISCSI